MRSTTNTTAVTRLAWRPSAFLILALAVGCAADKPLDESRPLESAATTRAVVIPSDLQTFDTFAVHATPPDGWVRRTEGKDDRSEHVVWESPGGHTAFGVLFFKLPFPVGHELAFRYGFLAEAKKKGGVADVIDKHWDDRLDGLRFTVDTRYFHVEAKFIVRGTRGWAAYAGSRRGYPTDDAEFEQARAAREGATFAFEVEPTPKSQSLMNADAR